ncbi:MAG: glutamate racemase [Candidatus Zixiibacteriota bacterium]
MTPSRKPSCSDKGTSRPIGIFDSGIGGLTVAKKIFELLPDESVIYFGDTARYPYGPRSKRIVRSFSFQDTNFLLRQRVKLIVVACNTGSAVALDSLRRRYDVPMIGVVEPGARAAARATRNGRIGVIGTVGTIHSGAYQKAIRRLNPQLRVHAIPCPLFVSLAEEGYINKEAARLIAFEYLNPLVKKGVDTLVLGCTHYPLLKGIIARVMGKGTKLIDSAGEAAKEVKRFLTDSTLLRDTKRKAFRRFYVSDVPDRFVQVGEKFLRAKIKKVKRVDIDSY